MLGSQDGSWEDVEGPVYTHLALKAQTRTEINEVKKIIQQEVYQYLPEALLEQ